MGCTKAAILAVLFAIAANRPCAAQQDETIAAFLARVEAPRRAGAQPHSRHAQDRAGRIVALDLRGVALAPGDCDVIARMTGLRRLDLTDTKTDDAGLRSLGSLRDLRQLVLWHTAIDGSGLDALAGLTRLELLDIGATRTSDAALRHVAGLPALRRLVLTRTRITDAGVASLAGMRSLRMLKLGETAVTDSCVPTVLAMKALRAITLEETPVTEAGVARLARDRRFRWMRSADATAREFVSRTQAGRHEAVDGMRAVGLSIPAEGTFTARSLEPLPQTPSDASRGLRRFRLAMAWRRGGPLELAFHADLAVDRGAVRVTQMGID